MSAFGDLIAPLSVDDFLARYWETTFLHLQGEPDRFSHYFSLRDVDRWLSSMPGHLYITPREEKERPQKYLAQELSVSIVYSEFVRGSTLVLEPMETWPPLLSLVRSLGRSFHAEIGARAYLMAEGARPLETHVAGEDTFVLHLEGERLWNLHESRLLQLNPPQKKNFKFPLTWYGRTKTPVQAQVRLTPGDALFIPRGMPYQGVEQKGACLYLWISITSLFWMDFLKIAAENAALHREELRRALPPGFVDDGEIRERMRRTFEEVMQAFQDVTSFDEVLAAILHNRVKAQGFPVDGHFTQLAELEKLDADCEVERRPDLLCGVDEIINAERITRSCIFFGREMVLGPQPLRRAYEFIRDHDRFRVSEIPGLDEESQLVLARRLIREGLLRRVEGS